MFWNSTSLPECPRWRRAPRCRPRKSEVIPSQRLSSEGQPIFAGTGTFPEKIRSCIYNGCGPGEYSVAKGSSFTNDNLGSTLSITRVHLIYTEKLYCATLTYYRAASIGMGSFSAVSLKDWYTQADLVHCRIFRAAYSTPALHHLTLASGMSRLVVHQPERPVIQYCSSDKRGSRHTLSTF